MDTVSDKHPPVEDGLSVRDWFAGQALAALIGIGRLTGSINAMAAELSADAYRYADAMMAERERAK